MNLLTNRTAWNRIKSLALIAKGDGQAARAMGSVDGPMADASPLGFAEPATFKNRRFAELTQDWIDRRHNGGAPPGIGAAQTLRDLNMTRPRPPSGPRHAGFDGFTRTIQNGALGVSMRSAQASRVGVGSASSKRSVEEPSASRPQSDGGARPAPAKDPLATPSSKPGSSASERAIDPSMGYLTSNDLAYGLRRMKGTADVYEKMLQVTQPRPADNQTFKSMWGDALKTGDLSLWKETCLGSTNQKYNNEVFPPEKLRENPHAKAARATFLKWMADSRMYFRDLMPWEQAQKAKEYMKDLTTEGQEKFLELMREVHNAVQPDQAPFLSTTHAHYPWPCQYADPATVELEKQETRYKAYGRPQKVEVKGFRRPVSKPTSEAKSDELSKAQKAKRTRQKERILPTEPFESSFSLAWAGGSAEPRNSTYAQHFASHPMSSYRDPVHPVTTVNPWKQPTAAFGPINTMAFPSMKETRPQAFLLPRYYTQTKDDLPSKAGKLAPETMYETKFKGGNMSPEALARTRVMQQERREALRQSTIPLGKGGVQHKNTGVTTYRTFFVDHPMDIEWRKERAEAMKTQINAPTVSVGRMAPFVETREEREARKGRTKDRRG